MSSQKARRTMRKNRLIVVFAALYFHIASEGLALARLDSAQLAKSPYWDVISHHSPHRGDAEARAFEWLKKFSMVERIAFLNAVDATEARAAGSEFDPLNNVYPVKSTQMMPLLRKRIQALSLDSDTDETKLMNSFLSVSKQKAALRKLSPGERLLAFRIALQGWSVPSDLIAGIDVKNLTSEYISWDEEKIEASRWFDITFTMVASTKDLSAAVKAAKSAAKKLGYPLRLGGFKVENEDADGFPTKCSTDGKILPCYTHRTGDLGKAVSIEKSDSFRGFTPDLLMVVIDDSSDPSETLSKAKAAGFADAYAKTGKHRIRGANECAH